MSQPTDINKFRKQKLKAKGKANTMCRRGFHKWQFDDKKQFDPKEGKLVSVERCERCGVTRSHVQ